MIDSVQDNNISVQPNTQAIQNNTRKITTKRIYPGFSLISAIKHKDYDLILKLLDDNIDINFLDEQGWSALHYAVQQNLQDIVKLLIAKGIKINQATQRGLTPLHISTWLNNSKITQTIIDSSAADVNLADGKGITPLLLATWLESHTNAQLFLNEGANVKKFSNDGLQAIHYAFIKGNLVCAKLLLKNGASLKHKSKDGKLPIDFAKEYNKFNLIQYFYPNDFEKIGDEYTEKLATEEDQLTFTQYNQIVSDKLFEKEGAVNTIDNEVNSDLEEKEDLLLYTNKEEIGERLLTYTANNNHKVNSDTDFNTVLKKQYQEQDIENTKQNSEAVDIIDNTQINNAIDNSIEATSVANSKEDSVKRHSTTKSIISKYGLKTSDLPQVVSEYSTELKSTLMNHDEPKKLSVNDEVKENKLTNEVIQIEEHRDTVKKNEQNIQKMPEKSSALIREHLGTKGNLLNENPNFETISEIEIENNHSQYDEKRSPTSAITESQLNEDEEVLDELIRGDTSDDQIEKLLEQDSSQIVAKYAENVEARFSSRLENEKEQNNDKQKQVSNNNELLEPVVNELKNTVQSTEEKDLEVSNVTSDLNENKESVSDDISEDEINDLLEEDDNNQAFEKSLEAEFSNELKSEAVLTDEKMLDNLTENQKEQNNDKQKQVSNNDELLESIANELKNTAQNTEEKKDLDTSNVTNDLNENKESVSDDISEDEINDLLEQNNDKQKQVNKEFHDSLESVVNTQESSSKKKNVNDDFSLVNQEEFEVLYSNQLNEETENDLDELEAEQINENDVSHSLLKNEKKEKDNTQQNKIKQVLYKSLESMNEYLSGNAQNSNFTKKDSRVVLNEILNQSKPEQSNRVPPKKLSEDVIKNRKTFQFKSLNQEFKKTNAEQQIKSASKQYLGDNSAINNLFDANFESDIGDKNYYISTRGKIFFSIDEMVIANMLENLNIEYVYKREITGTVKPGVATPSFTFIDEKNELIIWEHLHYNPFEKNSTIVWDEKNMWYQNNGFNYYINFFMTYFDIESANGFNSQNINNIALSIKARL